MRIQEMFYDDIDRKINGVVKVDQDAADVLKQEVKEYVITRDIRKHMITFFNNYAESFREPTADSVQKINMRKPCLFIRTRLSR